MPLDGSGNYTRDHTWASDAAAGIKIKADIHDTHDQDMANCLSLCLYKDGRNSPTANINWNAKQITNLAAGVSPTDAVNLTQLGAYNSTVGANPSGIVISGSTPNSRLKFTGATGPWGDSYVTADMASGVSGTTWVWNDQDDFSGTNVMGLSKSGNLNLTYTNDAATGGPILALDRMSNSPAVSDILGAIYFHGRSSTGVSRVYADIYASIETATNGAENGALAFETAFNGVSAVRLSLFSTGVTAYGNVLTQATGNFSGTAAIATLGTSAGGGIIALRPNGWGSAAGQTTVETNGTLTVANAGVFNGSTVYISGLPNGFCLSRPSTLSYLQWNTTSYISNADATSTMSFVNAGTQRAYLSPTQFVVLATNSYKPGGGPFLDSSDSRIKTVTGDYTTGLNEIKGLRAVRFTYKGNDTLTAPTDKSPLPPQMDADGNPVVEEESVETPTVPYANSDHYEAAVEGREFVGYVAQEAEQHMPGMVTRRSGYIDGVEVDDLRDLDTSRLIFAVVNAIKELDTRLEALEA